MSLSLLLLLAAGLHAYPVTVRGADEAAYAPAPPKAPALEDKKVYDAVVVGGGLSGLTAALYLSDAGKTVLLLEKDKTFGGLAQGAKKGELSFNRGAAYWTAANDEELKILERIGMGDYKNRHPIPEPIDSYLWNGTLYKGIWEHEALEKLPPSFSLFKQELVRAQNGGLIPIQPMEEAPNLTLDGLSAAQWIDGMPAAARARGEKWDNLPGKDPMKDVRDFLDLFCRSALGTTTGKLSAMAFANFYISEIETRYTSEVGTGAATRRLLEELRRAGKRAKLLSGATALRISQDADGAAVEYVQDGKLRRARSRYAVYAGQLKFAPKLIEGLSEKEPERAKAIEAMEYAHFSIHVAFIKGHPYRASYDTWVRSDDSGPDEPTDIILGRWMDPKIAAYTRTPPDDRGILAVYHPLALSRVGRGYGADEARKMAEEGVDRAAALLRPVADAPIEIRSVETNRWPYSLHVAAPGHFGPRAKLLRRPFGRVFFAHSNLGTPAFEEALFRGHCAADNVLLRLDPAFRKEDWSACPLEKP